MKRIAIIGGGISGLSAAYQLEKAKRSGREVAYAVYERTARLGGVLVTDRAEGCLIEAGPDSFLTEKPWAAALARELGLGDQIIGSNDAGRKTYILVDHRLVEMPDGLMFMVPTRILPTLLSPLFSLGTKLRMAREFFHPPHSGTHDESVAEMVERHYGHEMVERVADPLLAGVYGGQAAQLSVRAVLPRFVEMEQKYGSLGRAMLATRRRMAAYQQRRPPLFSSMKDGMQQLVDGLLAELDPAALRPGVEVQRVAQSAGRWMVAVAGTEPECFDGLVIATPARTAAVLLQDALSPLACELAGIAYSSSLTVSLVYERAALGHLPPGFGFLVPPNSGKRMLACTFVHNKFPHRAPPDKGLLRVFLGGSRDEAVLDLPEGEILRLVRDELRQVLKLEAEPAAARVYKWRASMAQYGPGHLERLGRMDALCRQVTGLALAGNAFRGIGVPDCVRSGREAAQRVLGSE